MSQSKPTSQNRSDAATLTQFRAVSKDWLEASCELFPEQASKLGFHKYDPLLSANTPELHLAHVALLESTLMRVESLADAAFQGDDWLDRRGLLARLRVDLLFNRDLARWRTNPQSHCGTAVDAVFELIVRGTGRLASLLPAIESRLEQIPAFLQAGTDCIKLPDPLWTSLAEKSCEGSIEFLEAIESELLRVSKKPSGT
jgi:hypothetical protein